MLRGRSLPPSASSPGGEVINAIERGECVAGSYTAPRLIAALDDVLLGTIAEAGGPAISHRSGSRPRRAWPRQAWCMATKQRTTTYYYYNYQSQSKEPMLNTLSMHRFGT